MICGKRLPAVVACLTMCLVTTAAVAGTWSEISVAQMQVELFVPDAPPRLAAGRPLMVNLHGCSQTGDLFRERGNWEATAEEFGMIVALPTVPNGGKIAGCW